MPGATPNRGYPYPVNTDPLNVAVDIEKLAEAIDLDITNVAAPTALVIRPWTADAAWGSLAHPAMNGTEAIVVARGAQPVILTSWTNQPVQIRHGAADAAHQLQVGLDHRFTGGMVYQMSPGQGFATPPNTDSQFTDHGAQGYFRPRDSANNTHIGNATGGRIFHSAAGHHFRHLDGTHQVLDVQPTLDRVDVNGKLFFPAGGGGLNMTDGTYVRTTDNKGLWAPYASFQQSGSPTWNGQQLIIQATTSHAGMAFVVHQNAWAVILRANPTSTLAPCVDVMLSETQGYANIAARAFNAFPALGDDPDMIAITDADLLARVGAVEGMTWQPPYPLDNNGQIITSLNLDLRSFGLALPALRAAFPETVALDDAGDPMSHDVGQVASAALAAAGALQRKIVDLETRLAALEV
jgi:hypothetical protein